MLERLALLKRKYLNQRSEAYLKVYTLEYPHVYVLPFSGSLGSDQRVRKDYSNFPLGDNIRREYVLLDGLEQDIAYF